MRTLLPIVLLTTMVPGVASAQGGHVVLRVDDPSGSHCIDADSEKITIYLRRVFTQRRSGFFTQDNKAGVIVRTQLSGDANGVSLAVTIPSMSLVSVENETNGRVSLALEYAIASNVALSNNGAVITDLDLRIDLAKTRSRTTFGEVLDLAGKALEKATIPANPLALAGSKLVNFANSAVGTSLGADQHEEVAQIASHFRRGAEPDLNRCRSNNFERTGALVVLRATGAPKLALIPLSNTERDYCFRYSSSSTYELLAAQRMPSGNCPTGTSAYAGVNNDYVMLLINATPIGRSGRAANDPVLTESARRCKALGLDSALCGA